jgi:hypothetical protein
MQRFRIPKILEKQKDEKRKAESISEENEQEIWVEFS